MPNTVRILVLSTLVSISVVASAAVPAHGETRYVHASALEQGRLVLRLDDLRADRVRSARLRVGGYERRLKVHSVKLATRRGVFRAWLPNRVRRRIRRGSARRAGQLVVVTRRPRLVLPSSGCSIPEGARHVSPSGSDSAPGTAERPWRTLERAEREAAPGQTVVIAGGSYGALGKNIWLPRDGRASAPITWVAKPGEHVRLRGHISVEGDARRFCGLVFDGPTGPASKDTPDGEMIKLYIGGDDVEVRASEVHGSRWNAGVYILGDRFRLVGNHIHHNGRFGDPSHANLDQGVYVGEGSGLIEGNKIEHNYSYGVQLYPLAHDVTVRGNTISRHGRAGVILAENAANNLVVDNDVYDNRHGIQAWELQGGGNAVRDNRLWNNADGDLIGLGNVTLSGNTSL